jgi:HlyD family secretion protein
MKIDLKRTGVAVAVLVVALTAYLWFRNGATVVTTGYAERDTLSVTVAVEGRTRARDLFSVAAPVTGQLARIGLEAGASVHEGDVLARIHPTLEDPRTAATLRADLEAARAALLEAEAGVEQATAAADQARRDAERRAALSDLGALSREVIEQAETAARLAERALEAAEAMREAAAARVQVARARLMGASGDPTGLPAFEVRSPVSGRVLRIPDKSARVVAAGTPLVELADVTGLEVVFDVLSEDAVRIESGQDILIREWGGEEILSGRVRTVTLAGYMKVSALGVEEQRVDVVGDLEATPPTLGSGYRVAGDVVVWRGEGVLAVPAAAVFRAEGGWAVFAVVDGRAELRPVQLGHRNDVRAEVVTGLEDGAEVVLFPPAALEPGTRLRTENPGS